VAGTICSPEQLRSSRGNHPKKRLITELTLADLVAAEELEQATEIAVEACPLKKYVRSEVFIMCDFPDLAQLSLLKGSGKKC
jgi:hypothetical protein